jgi:hypothetical protein
MRSRSRTRSTLLSALVATTLLAACSGGGGGSGSTGASSPTGSGSSTLAAQVASTDLYAGASQRVQVGVFSSTQDGTQLLTFGQVQVAFSYLGADGSGQPVAGPVAAASYVPAPGTPKGSGAPALSDPADARGVYQANDVMLDQPGVWVAEVTADVPGSGPQQLQAAFTVAEEPNLLVPGDRALKTKNLTMDSTDAPPAAIDSRAQDGEPVPDPELHRWTIARAIAEHRPALVLFATPLYCTSQFCGPTVDGLDELAKAYPDLAVYLHVEIWRDYDESVINRAAADWLWPDRSKDLTEPWLFLIGADGKIVDRWSPLFDPDEVAAELEALPAGGA